MDIISQEHRSWNMSRIRSKNTNPERIVRSFLHRHGFRFRLHVKTLPGTPDIVISKYRSIIEVRGCFWHRHEGCKYAYMPKTRIDFWQDKIEKNIRRDTENEQILTEMGYKVFIVWTCDISEESLERIFEKIRNPE